MASASFVEIISHFAGYLQIFHDIARDRVQYDESSRPAIGDYTTPRPNYVIASRLRIWHCGRLRAGTDRRTT